MSTRLLDEVISAVMAVNGDIAGRDKKEELLWRVAKLVVRLDPGRAEDFARSMYDQVRPTVLATMAAELVDTDRGRADRLFPDLAGQAVWSPRLAVTVAEMARSVAASDPRRSARLLRAIAWRQDVHRTYPALGTALKDLVTVVADVDPGRAKALVVTAERQGAAMKSAHGEGLRYQSAVAMTAFDRRRAERIARSMSRPAGTLAAVARVIAADDGDHAERIARELAVETRVPVLAAIAKANRTRSARLIDEAEQLAGTIMNGQEYERAVASLIEAIAVVDPDRAVRKAETVARNAKSPWMLCVAAAAIAHVQPDRAERIAESLDERNRAYALADVARAVAAQDPARAERLAQLLPDDYFDRQRVLADIATAMAATNPGRAERVANTVTDTFHKAPALLAVLVQSSNSP